MNANDLRKLAEKADGLRNTDFCMVDTGAAWDVVVAPAGGCNGTPIHTDDNDPARPSPNVYVEQGTQVIPLGDRTAHDAVFCSESSWGKFIKPYYSRMMEQDDFELMWYYLMNPLTIPILEGGMSVMRVIALAHAPKSEPGSIMGDPAAGPVMIFLHDEELRVAPSFWAFRQFVGEMRERARAGRAR
jgi:hypothetical protein